MAARKVKKDYIFAVGRRKTSVSRVRLYSGRGDNVVNGKPFPEYFPGEAWEKTYLLPFSSTNTIGKYWVSAKTNGGGKHGQLGALIHGISRALVTSDEALKTILKKEGLMTRDPRKRQRRHIGTGGKARRKKSSPKR